MHYLAMYSMRMQATIRWSAPLVALSIGVAFVASFKALALARRIRDAYSECVGSCSKLVNDRSQLFTGSVFMGLAIAGMHYIGMWAATFVHSDAPIRYADVLGTQELTTLVVSATLLVLVLSIAGGQVDRALAVSATRLRIEKELRARFVAAVVHDLRNPLAAALMGLQLVQSKSDRTNAPKLVGSAVRNLQLMDRLIQTLLDAHRISIGQTLPVHVGRVDLCVLLRETVESLREAHGDRFTLTCEAETCGDWDPLLVRRAVENLCINAVKYGSPGTPVEIEVREVKMKAPRVTIDVRNQGAPLSADEQSELFQLFKRGRGAEDTGQAGWGLGLFIVKGIAEAHCGAVHVHSTRETGTVFQLDLPRSAVSESASASPVSVRSDARKPPEAGEGQAPACHLYPLNESRS
jgi:signal transduction histidine kinase